jgi:hypothetical protein
MASALLFYIAKTLGISAVLWVYYVWFLRDERFHQYNRFYLLGVYVLSLGLPLIPWRWWVIEAPANLINNTGVWRPTGAEYTTPSADQWVVSAALGVSTVLLLLLIYRVVQVLVLEKKYPKRRVQQAMIVETDLENAPFSFWNRLFWKSSLDLTQGPGQKIFKHEYTHIVQKHTLDRLVSQLMRAVFWVNPFYWLIAKELETIHEFIADQSAVGTDAPEALAEMLLTTHFESPLFQPTHLFNVSSIKRRIMMLTQPKNTQHAYLRKISALFLTAGLFALFTLHIQAQEAPMPPAPPTAPQPEFTWTNKDTLTPTQVVYATVPKSEGKRKKQKNQKEHLVIRQINTDTIVIKGSVELKNINPADIAEINVRQEKGKDAVYIVKRAETGAPSSVMVFHPNGAAAGKAAQVGKVASISWSADNQDEISMTVDAKSHLPSGKDMEFYVNGDKVSKAVAMALDPEKIITVDVKKQDKNGVSTDQVWIVVKE